MVFCGILILALGLIFTRPIAIISGADEETLEFTVSYLRWIFIGAPVIMLANGFACGIIYYFVVLIIQHSKKNELINISPKEFSVEKEMVGNVVKIGIPGALMTVLLSVSNIVLTNFISIYGSDSVAAYGIAYKIDMFPILLSVGLSQGSSPLQ